MLDILGQCELNQVCDGWNKLRRFCALKIMCLVLAHEDFNLKSADLTTALNTDS